jgi:hypothetical protein
MDKEWRDRGLLATGVLVGGIAVLGAALHWVDSDMKSSPSQQRGPQVAAVPASPPTSEAAATPTVVPAPASTCPSEPLAAASNGDDGQFVLQRALASASPAQAPAFVVVAREAAAQGRMRDAEVALLAACHIAEASAGRDTAPLADVKSELGQHYVLLASRQDGADAREDLLQRATWLLSDSANTYAAALGRNASKTRMAEERLAAVRSPDTLQAALPPPSDWIGTLGAAPAPERIAPVPDLVRSDPDLAQLENDLQRLYAQAESVSRDPAGLRRRDAQAIAQRDERCQDKTCLLRWYERRRAQLLAEF